MKNKFVDLNDHLFAQIERLSDEDLIDDGLKEEITRSKAIANVAKEIINNGKLMLDARKKLSMNTRDRVTDLLSIEVDNDKY